MVTTLEFKEPSERNDRIVQLALREIDMHVLAEAMVDMSPEEREIIFRNMSERACEFGKEEIGRIEKTVSVVRKAESRDFWLQLLSRSAKHYPGDSESLLQSPPDLKTETAEELVETFTALGTSVRSNSLLKLEGAGERTTDPLLRLGFELIVDGTDPLLVREILERMKETTIADTRRHCEMIIEGILGIQSNEHPLLTQIKLKAFLPK